MSFSYTYKGYPILITRRSNAVQLKLRYTPGREHFDLTVPPGTTRHRVDAFLRESEAWLEEHARHERTVWKETLAPGEGAMLRGERVTLGRNGIPAGDAFLRLRNEELCRTLNRLLPLWTRRMGVSVTKLTLRQMTSKWGSCAVDSGHVTLNLSLGAMPEELTEYVLVHELTHMHHPDHSPAFHAEMTRLLPDWRQRKDRLNRFGPLFFPPEEDK